MKAYAHILFSQKLNRYYIGSTELEPDRRLELHLSKNYGRLKFTAKADDWEIRRSVCCESLSQARKIESYLKQMRNRKYLEWLISDTERFNELREKIEKQKFWFTPIQSGQVGPQKQGGSLTKLSLFSYPAFLTYLSRN